MKISKACGALTSVAILALSMAPAFTPAIAAEPEAVPAVVEIDGILTNAEVETAAELEAFLRSGVEKTVVLDPETFETVAIWEGQRREGFVG